ncbi:MAG TPA: glycoside hydrolase family 2 TIM barrel-domain containing protein [Flavilitoribacter sp.]|nr:glycoside hydrolase family 2 TIM barrel-domain containing protein [Flavilitoribacter sp.]HMQ86549.1 glycoside hydrolase family 2 TIM barrel-domain containing protein [Flavilitoribacter sp.]
MKGHFKPVFILLLLTIQSIPGNTQAPDRVERKQLFDDNWKFSLEDSPGAGQPGFRDENWRTLNLPHDWSIEGQLDPNNPMGNDGGYLPAGVGWYRKKFTVPASWQGKLVSVYFEGVYMNAEVFINGKSLGAHPYGYTSFRYDLTPFLHICAENVLAVSVDNAQQKNCRWYSGSGIYRHVWLEVSEPVHIDHWGVAVTTPEASPEQATVLIKTRIKNETASPQRVVLSAQLSDQRGEKVGKKDNRIDLPPNCEKEISQTIDVQNPMLWSPENPYLYRAGIEVIRNKKTIDGVTDLTVGIRSIRFTPENGFQLNGKTVLINGGCVHHDNGCLGAAAFDRAEQRKAELLKAAGFNAVRTAHNPPSEAFLDACDRIGLLVLDESFDGWRSKKNPYDYARIFDEWWQRDIESMVLRDRNHPSVFMWSIGNEIYERKKPEAVETAKMLAGAVRAIDPTRPVTSAMTGGDEDWASFDPLMAQHDVCGYNYHMHLAESDHERVPSRIVLHTESFPKDAFYIRDMVQKHDYIIGDFVWTAMDYLGESGIGRWFYSGEVTGEHWERSMFPWHAAYCGDIDLTGWRKPVSHYRSMLYNDDEKLYMAVREPEPAPLEIHTTKWAVWPTWESWTWPGYEGKDLQVEVYAKYPKVRLYLNDRFIGEQPTARDQEFKATFILPYSPGVLKAVGVEDGQEGETIVLQTAGEASGIRLSADRTTLSADGQDLSFITVNITDQAGVFQPNADNRLHFRVEGPGIIAGVANGDIKDLDPYVSDTRKAWHGRALVVIRSKQTPGSIRLTVSSDGLPDAGTTINVVIPEAKMK